LSEFTGEKHFLKNCLQNPYLQPEFTPPDTPENVSESFCQIEPVSFKMVRYIESLNSVDDIATTNDTFASQLLSFYRPKGRTALLSPLLHVGLIMACCFPTLALFTLWAFKQYDYYYYLITQTTAFFFLVVCFYLYAYPPTNFTFCTCSTINQTIFAVSGEE
jgi:hypothetical protein